MRRLWRRGARGSSIWASLVMVRKLHAENSRQSETFPRKEGQVKILAFTQADVSMALLKMALGGAFDRITWAVCHQWDSSIAKPEPGVIFETINREKPDVIIAFGRICFEALSKEFQTSPPIPIIQGPSIPDLDPFLDQIEAMLENIPKPAPVPVPGPEPEVPF